MTTEVELFIKKCLCWQINYLFWVLLYQEVKKTKIWNYQLSNLGFGQSVPTPVTAIFKDSLGIHSTLTSLLQVTGKRIKVKKKSLQCEEEKTTLSSVLC